MLGDYVYITEFISHDLSPAIMLQAEVFKHDLGPDFPNLLHIEAVHFSGLKTFVC